MWCVPTLDAEYIARMEDVLNVLAHPYDRREPVVTFDERPVALRGTSRPGRSLAPGQIAREDYEYVRTGTANVYCIVEPKAGRHVTYATRDRKAPRFAAALQRIARRYPTAQTIHLDHLAIYHRQGAVRLPLQTAEHCVAVEALGRRKPVGRPEITGVRRSGTSDSRSA